MLAIFHAVEPTSRLTDQLIAGNGAALPPQALLMELERLEAALDHSCKKNELSVCVAPPIEAAAVS